MCVGFSHGVFLPSVGHIQVLQHRVCTTYYTASFFVVFFFFFSTAEGFFSRSDDNSMVTGWETFLQALGYFLKMFFGSAALGTLTGLISALVSLPIVCKRRLSFVCVFVLCAIYIP